MNISSNALHTARKKVLFLSDLDGTWLSKNPENREMLDQGIVSLKDQYRERGIDLEFGYVTARPPARVAQEHLPAPDWTVTFNGAKIHQGAPGRQEPSGEFTEKPDSEEWNRLNARTGYTRDKAKECLDELLTDKEFQGLTYQTVGTVVNNPAADDSDYTSAVCFPFDSLHLNGKEKADADHNGVPDILEEATFAPPAQLTRLQEKLQDNLSQEGIGHELSPVYPFHGKPYLMFDLASPIANKGDAVSFLQQLEGVTPDHTILAGDGGNDIAMMTAHDHTDEGRRAIVVGANAGLREAASDLSHAIIQPADMDSSLAVLDGLSRHLEAIAGEN